MPAPLGWDRRDEPGVVGRLARWWGRRRVAQVRRALEEHGTPPGHSEAPADPGWVDGGFVVPETWEVEVVRDRQRQR